MVRRVCCLFFIVAVLTVSLGCAPAEPLQIFPAGYLDSPYLVPDGSSLYFSHSPSALQDIMRRSPSAQPVTAPLDGHQAVDGDFWWNTDLYASSAQPDGRWSPPANLGPLVNTRHMETSPWVSADQTVLIFTRVSVGEDVDSGSFIARRSGPAAAWGEPVRLPGELGDYLASGFVDFQQAPNGDLYFWSELSIGDGTLFRARLVGPDQWAPAEALANNLQSDDDETQPWVNGDQTVLYFNRRGEEIDTQLLRAQRPDAAAAWGEPVALPLSGLVDVNDLAIWGEPCLTDDGRLFFVRFDTAVPHWRAEICVADPDGNGGFGAPRPLQFSPPVGN
ncbi:MAG: hypothetical protein A2087_08265 [Spirochaetes bacterium GWD1_61_31]|nr:MAG: hypothetical protein A2Y37_13815 [Spirochaetes bacterium GWB1_60_80]OHD32676.1 MAG: hypothetical protein A2004_02370 [Spirochaetes bacterium GWC1_61_12]OHD42082.1 MAG: hypothetical protein A2Y35_07470 [Spirochaetes bacterium GWE1_60_18]OHD42458.1 MAG: hypothetical protein A2087_08265 [Spirochaetes bacterium GWD1_61_31]OHD60984.1 MAG: hypothetical protein A2Y32_03440 [Spirochaetes bacterium GWF1_60_12]HAP42790.1 hypothetical protein [Spirochaetaceae bacterium]